MSVKMDAVVLPTRQGPTAIKGKVFGVWVVHRPLGGEGVRVAKVWTLSHLPSGLALCSLESQAQALSLARHMAEHANVGASWTPGAQEGGEELFILTEALKAWRAMNPTVGVYR